MTTLAQLNAMSATESSDWFMQTCSATRWCQLMTQSRPYQSITQLVEYVNENWQQMRNSDYMEAFDGHPMIGDINSLREKYLATKAIAGDEQAGTATASESTLQALQQVNKDYLEKHGFIFIICASGLSAKAMLDALQVRIQNNTDTEVKTAAQEQLKITLLRIYKALNEHANALPTVEEMPHE